jgi:hypothetical protein
VKALVLLGLGEVCPPENASGRTHRLPPRRGVERSLIVYADDAEMLLARAACRSVRSMMRWATGS